jgi:phytoene synthase
MSVAAPAEQAALQAQVSGSSFYVAMLLLPKAEREAMFALYAFCRLVDDIADDGTRSRSTRAVELQQWRSDLDALFAGRSAGRAAFLAPAVKAFDLGRADFLSVIDGMDMDVVADIRAPDRKTLALYCERVAEAVGRLSVKIFGMDEAPGLGLAHSLGHALQLTNILRDLDEDADIGRLYLPRELLQQAGISTIEPRAAIDDPRVDSACRVLATEADELFADADRLLRSRPRGHLRPPKLMAAVYRATLHDMQAEGWRAPRRRIRIAKPRLLAIVARCLLLG